MTDCSSALGVTAAQYQPVVAMCQAATSGTSGTDPGTGPGGISAVHQFSLICGSGQVSNCIPPCDEHVRGDLLLLSIQGDDHKFSCERQHGMLSWIAPSADGGYLGNDFQAFFSAVVSGAAGLYMSTVVASLSISTSLIIQPGQNVHINGASALLVAPTWGSGGFVVAESGSLSLAYLTIAGAISVASGGSLTLGSPLTLVDAVLALLNLATHSTGNVSFGSGGVTLADAHGTTLGTAAGSFPGDVQLTQLTVAGQVAFGARAATATLSRDAHGALAASGLRGIFASASGPCTLTQGGRCAHRGAYNANTNEHCALVVGWGGTLGACPSFALMNARYTRLTIGSTSYGEHHCPQGVHVAACSTITWDIISDNLGSNAHSGWEICF